MLSRRLGVHVAEARFEALPEATRAAAARALLDGLGVMLGASGSGEAAPFVSLAAASARDDGATVLGQDFRAQPAAAALANGAMAHVLDYEDAFDAAPCHPNASLLPAALAVAETEGPVSGAELITAIAVGCDLVCRLAQSLTRPMEQGGWYPPPILGAFGAAAAAAKLRRLDARGLLDAWSLMLAQNSCPGEIKYSPDSVMRAVREAFPAQAAVNAAALAAAGVRGFDAPFEGEAGFYRLFAGGDYDEAALLDGLGETFLVEQLTFKAWPCCRGTHGYIEAIERLRSRVPLDWRGIESVTLAGSVVQRMLAEPLGSKRRPSTATDAKFSLPFTVATALVVGEVGLDSFTPARLTDPEIAAVADLVSWEEAPGWGRGRPAGGIVRIRMGDGQCLEEEIEAALGDPGRPLDDARLHAKFLDCAARAPRPPRLSTRDEVAVWIDVLPGVDDAAAWLREML